MESTLFVKLIALLGIVLAFLAVVMMSPRIWGGASGISASGSGSLPATATPVDQADKNRAA